MKLNGMQDITSTVEDKASISAKFVLSGILRLSSEALDRLDNDEKQELEGFANVRRQQEYLTSRLAIKEIVDGMGVSNFKILKDELGQPYGEAGPEKYYVSIAHTNERVFCGVSASEPIGVDLEPVGRRVSDKLKRRILHPDEGELFGNMQAIRLWTIKEAFIKLRGQGLRLNMNQVEVRESGDEFEVEINNDKTAKICSFKYQNSWLAIAYYQ